MSTPKHKLNQNQQGIASILVTMIIMIIISLIVLGLARLSRREQRQSLDNQLSTQAFYAAESGVNDVVKKIKDGTAVIKPSHANTCNGTNSFIADNHLTNILDATSDTQYTCLLVNSAPRDLQIDVNTDQSAILPIVAHDDNGFGRLIESLQFSWQNKTGSVDASGCNASSSMDFPAEANWPAVGGSPANCTMGIIRVDTLGADASGANGGGNDFHRQTIASGSHTFFLYPVSSGGKVQQSWLPVDGAHEGMIVPVQCDGNPGPLKCTVLMDFIFPGGNNYKIRMRTIYAGTSTVNITGFYNGLQTSFEGQTLVDATGKANDVLRRIQVRVPQKDTTYPIPEFAIQTGDILCKRLTIQQIAPNTAGTDKPGVPACDPLH